VGGEAGIGADKLGGPGDDACPVIDVVYVPTQVVTGLPPGQGRKEKDVNGGAVWLALNCHHDCMAWFAAESRVCNLVMCCWCHLQK
jgi:hypothetical protein